MSKPVLPNSASHENELSAGQNTGGSSSSGFTTPRKRSSIQGTDRQTFHKLFQAALKSNQLSSEGGGGGGGTNGSASGGAGSYGRSPLPSPQIQEREEVYQNERGDVIWLELQVGKINRNKKIASFVNCSFIHISNQCVSRDIASTRHDDVSRYSLLI